MIQLEQALDAVASDPIASLDLSMFSDQDILNIVLQRSEVLRDYNRPGRIIKSWTEGEEGPIRDVIADKGTELIRRAAAFIYLEFLELEPLLTRLTPKRVADIGCGYAFFDLFVAQKFSSNLVLIDLEQTSSRHFGFAQQGAAYTSLQTAQKMLVANGVAPQSIEILNPNDKSPETVQDIDLAVSFVSCGFHYPYDTYLEFFQKSVLPTGSVILDFRRIRSAKQISGLSKLGQVEKVGEAAYGGAIRVHLEKSGDQNLSPVA